MKFSVFMLAFMASTVLWAETITTTIHDIYAPDSEFHESYLVLANNGHVYEVDASSTDLISELELAKKENLEITFNIADFSINSILGQREMIEAIQVKSLGFDLPVEVEDVPRAVPTPLDNYRVSRVQDLDQLKTMFKTMTRKTRRKSQCYNRAHVWIWEMTQKAKAEGKNLKMGKLWLFFGRRYIKRYRYKWWFHIAPYLHVKGDPELYVMDRSFTKGPRPLRRWTNIFMKNNAPCKEVRYYSDYKRGSNGYKNWCYVIKSSQYYWQPRFIKGLEREGEESKIFKKYQLKKAYKDGIKGWKWSDQVIPYWNQYES